MQQEAVRFTKDSDPINGDSSRVARLFAGLAFDALRQGWPAMIRTVIRSLQPPNVECASVRASLSEKRSSTCKIMRLTPKSLEKTSMPRVILGNHAAVTVARSEQDKIRRFYIDVLGCAVKMSNNDVDRFQLADAHLCFVYQDRALNASDFSQAIWLELRSADVDGVKRKKILAFGVKKLDVPDPHLYFQAPGGQVFRLVGINEDLTVYEQSPSSRPRPAASAARRLERDSREARLTTRY